LTDVDAVRDAAGVALERLTASGSEARIECGELAGGMVPKVRAAFDALERGTPLVKIANGCTGDAIVTALAEGVGTRLCQESEVVGRG